MDMYPMFTQKKTYDSISDIQEITTVALQVALHIKVWWEYYRFVGYIQKMVSRVSTTTVQYTC